MVKIASLHVAKTYAPEQNGAKRFAKRHGASLVCVRQRLSADGHTRYTTIELLVETTPVSIRARSIVAVRIGAFDVATRSALIGCGACWDTKQKYWLVSKVVATNLRLGNRVVPWVR